MRTSDIEKLIVELDGLSAEYSKRLERFLSELEKLKAEKAASEWPKEGDRYWAIYMGDTGKCAWWNDTVDNKRLSIDNVFRTKEEAEAEIEARKVVAELRRQPGVKRFVVEEDNWTPFVNIERNSVGFELDKDTALMQTSVWFDSKESVHAAIQAVGEDRIIKAARWWALGEC